ncbi:hypothetical protein RchiOBHm_Chr3g0464741 [Rosa chinensis]|uniref:Uncharacterized protein n=1 Tax=Rosa chinensis TaxID=74649 RepID=A0A2P6R9J7_ROSCH|nr:hypothetical protein RchiOBHm_Chr3g0464741 [Rosa chinensis]
MEERKGSAKSNKVAAENQEKWVYDSSVDHKGNVPLRASTGVWKASLFIVAAWSSFSDLTTSFFSDRRQRMSSLSLSLSPLQQPFHLTSTRPPLPSSPPIGSRLLLRPALDRTSV